ncbi:MAG TPA: CoA transferase [Pyrinomonadaceae bacterium]|jgi:crotonobetainyl-CoA:carnitine CoA-transferase CaiB-like acyl-CoA transferase
MSQTKMNETLLEGVKIVSLAMNLPGPLAVRRLRQMGASVIKVEPPVGDPFADMCTEWYRELIEGQKVVRLNLKDSREKTELEDLLRESDVLITSMRQAAIERLGFGWKRLHHLFPRLSQVAITGYPAPNENLAGHDLTYQAAANLLSPPDLPRALLADAATAERVFSAVLTLLLAKEKGLRAECQQISIVETTNDFAAPLRYCLTGEDNLLGGKFAGYSLYPTAQNGWIALAALESSFWQRLNAELGFKNAGKKDLEKVFLTRTAQEWKTWAIKLDIPLEIIR